MNTDSSRNERRNYEAPCKLLPVTEFDGSKGIPPDELAKIPVGGLIRDELLLEPLEIDCSPGGNGQSPATGANKLGKGQKSSQKGCEQPFLDDSAGKGAG